MSRMSWRGMKPEDLADVVALATGLFPKHYEEPFLFKDRLRRSSSTCFVLQDDDGALRGYLVAYFWCLGSIPPINAPMGPPPGTFDCVFVHDLALHPDAAGRGMGTAVLSELVGRARAGSASCLALVAVNGSAGFWEANGFRQQDEIQSLQGKLATYGHDARYMIKPLRD